MISLEEGLHRFGKLKVYSWEEYQMKRKYIRCVVNVKHACILHCVKTRNRKDNTTPEDVSPKSFNSPISYGGTEETPSTFTSCFHHAITTWYIFHTIIHTNK